MPQTATATLGYADYRPGILRQIEAGEIKPALATLLELQRHLPADAGLWDDIARCSWSLGDTKTALGLAELVANTLVTQPAAWGKLGAMALELGNTDLARAAFETALRHAPHDAHALAALNRIAPFAKSSPRTGVLRRITKDRNAAHPARIAACNALGRIEEAAGSPRAAFRHFARAKALSPGRYDMAAVDAKVDAICHSMPAAEGAAIPDTPRLIFICGLPRSGTTLVESILLQHDEVDSLGESPALSQAAQLGRKLAGSDDGTDWLAQLDDAHIAQLRSHYLDACHNRRTTPLPPVLVDKTPLNLFELGLARRIFPDALFMFLSRHPLDTGLSNFTTNFHAAHPFSHRLDSIGHMIRAAHRVAAHHENTLGKAFRRISLRALVSGPETQIRALLDHAGLSWSAACLTPEHREGPVGTASLSQVRAPISTGSLGKWQHYETELGPLITTLGGWGWINDWERTDAAG